ncbi:hypothetical protein PM8797T_25686 [Gimesia maris DSM 8797]|nr:hypothetical protein PM8797T_25686 [Gimesia maris DSM 8797]
MDTEQLLEFETHVIRIIRQSNNTQVQYT